MVNKFLCIKKLFLEVLLQNQHLHSIKSSVKFMYAREHLQYLYLVLQFSHFSLSCP